MPQRLRTDNLPAVAIGDGPNRRLQRMLAIVFAGAVLALGAAFVLTMWYFEKRQDDYVRVARAEEFLSELHGAANLSTGSQSAIRGYVITESESYLTRYLEFADGMKAQIARLSALVEGKPPQQERLDRLARLFADQIAWHRRVVAAVREQGVAAGRAMVKTGQGEAYMLGIRQVTHEMESDESAALRANVLDAGLSGSRARATAILLALMISVLFGGCYMMVRHHLDARQKAENILRQLNETLDQRVRERTAQLEGTTAELRREIAEHQQSEAARRESDDRFRAVVDQAPDAIFVHTAHGVLLDVNQQACAALGYSREELLRLNIAQLDAESWAPDTWRTLCSQMRPGLFQVADGRYRRKDGTTFPVEIRVGCHDFRGQRLCLQIARDMTRRQQAERKEAQLAAIVESCTDAIVSSDMQGIVTTWNHAAERLLGYTAAEAVGRPLSLVIPADRMAEVSSLFAILDRGENVTVRESVRRHKDGHLIPVTVAVSAIKDSAGRVIGRSAILHDITAQKQLENEVIRVSDYEQRRLGHDLHDGIGQQLTAIEIMMHSLAERLPGAQPKLVPQATAIGHHLRDAIGQVRMLARGLAPFFVDADGLQVALENLLGSAGERIRCRLVCRGAVALRSSEIGMQLYRIAQEAFNNALKHSGATEIEIRLLADEGSLRLEVADNGRGLPEHNGSGGGVGLQIMRYRAGLIGARFELISRASRGLTVACTLPTAP